MQPNTMDCDTPEALRFFASACDRPVEGEWMRKAADEIERLRDERRWIPVEDRLPEKGKRVIFFVDRKQTGLRAAYVGEYVSHSAFQSWACYEDERGWSAAFVTHWMPLPEPPEVK